MVERFERFSYAMFEISRCWHKLATEVMGQYELKGPYAIYLVTLLRSKEPLTAARLTEICARDKADVSRALADMEKRGMILRQGTQYRAVLTLTEKGRRVYGAYSETVLRLFFQPIFRELDRFTPEQLDAMQKVYQLIIRQEE